MDRFRRGSGRLPRLSRSFDGPRLGGLLPIDHKVTRCFLHVLDQPTVTRRGEGVAYAGMYLDAARCGAPETAYYYFGDRIMCRLISCDTVPPEEGTWTGQLPTVGGLVFHHPSTNPASVYTALMIHGQIS